MERWLVCPCRRLGDDMFQPWRRDQRGESVGELGNIREAQWGSVEP